MIVLRNLAVRLVWVLGLASAALGIPAAFAQDSISSGDPIQQIVIEGNQRIEPETVRSYMELNPGDPFDAKRIDRALKNMFATGLFADVNFRRDGGSLVVQVVENPIINKLAFEGNDRIDDKALQDEVSLKPRQVYTQSRVQSDVKTILELYRRSGRFAATVEPKVIKLDQNRVNLVFEITEGDVTAVERIDFVGNKAFSDNDLRDEVITQESAWYRFLSTNDTYDPDRLTVDKEQLRKFYLTEGYADFRVISAVAELSPDQEAFFITFTVAEGERYKLGKIDIQSTLKDLDPLALQGDLMTHEGDWYDASEVDQTVQALSDRVGSLGYAFVDVRPRIDRDAETHVLTLTYDIQEGPKVYVERIDISGNVRTQDKVIRREFRLAEGDAFSTSKLKRTEQRLKNLGFFESVDIQTVPSDSPDKTVIKVKVKEQSTGELSFGAGFSTSVGPLGNVGFRERNLLGKGQDLRANLTVSGKRSAIDISFTDPYFLDKDLSAGVDIFLRRFDLSKYREEQIGAGLRFGYEISEFLRHTISYQFRADRIHHIDDGDHGGGHGGDRASEVIFEAEGYTYYSILGSTFRYDRLDNTADPRDGYFLQLDSRLAGLGGSVRYSSQKISGGYFYAVNNDVSVGLTNEVGYIKPIFGDYLHYPDGFFLGGPDSLRGFAVRGVGPHDEATNHKQGSIGGQFLWDGTLQTTFPLGLPEEYAVRGRVFSDFGMLTGYDSNLNSDELDISDIASVRASVGAGLTWISPFGPLAVDFALPVLKHDQDVTEFFSFSFGTSF